MEFFIKIIFLFLTATCISWIGLRIISSVWKKYENCRSSSSLWKWMKAASCSIFYRNNSHYHGDYICTNYFMDVWFFCFTRIKTRSYCLTCGTHRNHQLCHDLDTISRKNLAPPIVRLCLQIFVGLIIGITSIKITYVLGYFEIFYDLMNILYRFPCYERRIMSIVFPLLITVCWYVLVFNSVNFSDGIPGLTGSFSLVSFIIMGWLAIKLFLVDQNPLVQENSKFLITLMAVVIPTTFFMTRMDVKRSGLIGDTGTMMLAFIIATSAIIVGGKIATAMSVLGIYLIDALYVIGIRLAKWKNPMKWDRTHHLHFRLLELGLTPRFIRNLICGLAFMLDGGYIYGYNWKNNTSYFSYNYDFMTD